MFLDTRLPSGLGLRKDKSWFCFVVLSYLQTK